MSIHREIFQALKEYMIANLSEANWVSMAYLDERADTSDKTSYPLVTIQLYDNQINNEQRIGGMRVLEDNGDDTTNLLNAPIPMNFYFQLDVLSDKFNSFWDLSEQLMIILGRRWSCFTTSGGQKLHIIFEDVTPIPELIENLHRKSFRFYVQAWLPDDTVISNINQVLTLQISKSGQEIPGGIVEVP
jgi:hypothetical protein